VISAAGLGLIGWNGHVHRAGNDLTAATALAAAGLAALVALPFLILLSLALGTPFAVPAAIALGYLGLAHATAIRNARRAAAWSVAVFFGLVGWAVFCTISGGEPGSPSSVAAVLLAPLFAGAPALARALLTAGRGPARRTPHQPAPSMRMERTARAPAPEIYPPAEFFAPAAGPAATAAPRCDLQEAISFALQRVAPKAKAGGIALICEGESDVVAASDRALGRRISCTLLDTAIGHCGQGGVVSVETRNLRGAVLLRVSVTLARVAPDVATLRGSPALAALAATIDAAGGTMMFDTTAEGTTISVRLASAADWMAERRNGKHPQAA
jgi:hypothetical protein